MKKEYVTPELEFEMFSIYCDMSISSTESSTDGWESGDNGEEASGEF